MFVMDFVKVPVGDVHDKHLMTEQLKKRKKGKVIGIVAINPDTGATGWSLCSRKDAFDMKRGLDIALGRTKARSEATKGSYPVGYEALIQERLNMLETDFKNLFAE